MLAVIGAAPVLFGLVFVGIQVMAVVFPVGVALMGIWALVRWIRKGKDAE